MLKFLLTTVDTGQEQSKLALRSLYSVVANAPLDTRVRLFRADASDDEIYEEIVYGGYNIVYFHCDLENEETITHLCEIVKKAVPTSIVIVGGRHVTSETRAFMMSHQEVDYVLRGEGEKVLFEFLRTVLTYEFAFDRIPGLAYWENDVIRVNKMGPPLQAEEIPFPYEYFGVAEGETAYYESVRGCPDRCYYRQYTNQDELRVIPLSRVSLELRYFLTKEVREVVFLDKWFNFYPDRAYRIWEYIIDHDNGVTAFRFDVNADFLDENTIRLLGGARKGLFTFDIDIESTNPEALAMSGRKENIYQLLFNTENLIRDTKVRVNVYQKIGLPYENTELFARAFNKIYALNADHMQVDAVRMLKGTRLRLEADKYGYRYSSKPPYEVIASDFLKAPDLIRIKMAVETAELFPRSLFGRSLLRISRDTGLRPFQLFMKLGEYIYKKGLLLKTGKLENLYKILHTFAYSLYDEMSLTLKLQILTEIITSEYDEHVPSGKPDIFDRKEWADNDRRN